jgi:hypothetical protein
MSNQQPPHGQGGQSYGGQPGYGQQPQGQPGYSQHQAQPGYGRPQQAPYQGQPGQAPYQGQPGQAPYQGRQPYPNQQQPQYPGQQQYQGQQYPGQQQYPQQQGYPGQQQQYPQQQGYPGQQQPYGGQQQWSPQYGGRPSRAKGGNKILFLAGGGLAVVAVIGIVLALIFGRGDDKKADPTPQPQPQPTTSQSTEPTGNVDEGIEVAEGVYVKPQPGYIRKSLDDFKGVYLLKQGEAYFMVNAWKAEDGESTQTVLPELLKLETKDLSSIKKNEPKQLKPGENDKTEVKVVTTQSFSAVSTTQNGSMPVIGFVGVIERNDGVITIIRVYGRKDKMSTIQTDSTAMLQSVIKSQ